MRAMMVMILVFPLLFTGCVMPPSDGSGQNDNAGNDNDSPPGPSTHVVSMVNIAFAPESLTIKVGDTVRWSNDETAAINHTVTSGVGSVKDDDALLDSGFIARGDFFEFTFDQAGLFTYFCEIHPVRMTDATITVEE